MTKLIQLNTWQGGLASNVDRFLERQNADILMLQEVLSSPEGQTFYFDKLQQMKAKSNLEHDFFSPLMGHVFQGLKTYYGNAILSRFKFEKTYAEFTHLAYNDHWNPLTDSDEMKLFQHGVVSLPSGVSVNLVNYHGFNMHSKKEGNAETEKHCMQIAQYLDTIKGPKILTGDFNLAPDSLSLAPLNSRLKNLCIENKVETTRNQLAKSMTVVDYIWVSDSITVNRFEVLPDLVSDHAALLLEFDI